jgi:hypothetical protein
MKIRLNDETLAKLGSLKHELFVLEAFGDVHNSRYNQLLTVSNIATFVHLNFPELVPGDNPNGTHPSDHTVAKVFRIHYFLDQEVRQVYFKHVAQYV